MYVVFRSSDEKVSVTKTRDVCYETSLLNTRVASDLPVARDLYEVRETSLLSNSPLINGHANGTLNGEDNGNSETSLTNGASNGFSNGRRFTADNYSSEVLRLFTRRLSEDGTANRALRVENANIDEQNGNDRGCCDDFVPLMIDKSVQCEINMADDGVDSASDYRGGMQMDNFTPPAARDAEVTVVNEREWSTPAAGLNETVPVTAKTAQLSEALLKRIQPPAELTTEEAIKAWKKELADKQMASTSAQQHQQKPPAPPVDDGPRYKLNNDGSESPDPDRNLNNTSTWRVRDSHRSCGSTSSDDEIEKISYLEMGGEGDKPDKPDGAVRSTQPNNRPTKDPRPEPEEEDGECVIRCLAYTLQCCECVIS